MSEPRLTTLALLVIGLLVSFTINPAEAYIDPGTTGLLSQVMYVLFYAALGVFLYCLQYIKRYLISLKHVVLKVFGGRKQDQDSPK